MVAQALPTRQRLLDSALRLFAERGFAATRVGDIESAAGLQPRRGALYKHFASKTSLLEEAVEGHLAIVRRAADQLNTIRDLDVAVDPETARALLAAMARWLLAELDSQRPLIAIFERDGDRLPDLRDRFRDELINVGYGAAAKLLGRLGVRPARQARSLAVVLVGSLINSRRDRWTFGATALNFGDDALIDTWATVALAAARDR